MMRITMGGVCECLTITLLNVILGLFHTFCKEKKKIKIKMSHTNYEINIKREACPYKHTFMYNRLVYNIYIIPTYYTIYGKFCFRIFND